MSRLSSPKGLSLKWLEIFQICARSGSLKEAADETGLAISTVSHHLRCLEDHLGAELFNHTRRPMVLTPKGQVFLRNIDVALHAIRKAKAEATNGDLAGASYLRLGMIEDLDSDVTPDLAVHLADLMPDCAFLYHTASSHEVIGMLRDRKLDLGITVTPHERMRDLEDQPLLRDPFIMVLPKTAAASPDDIVARRAELPFLQFSSELIIARQIQAQLRRLGVSLPDKFECGSNQTLMAMVASGAGWTITTPLLFARAQRFQPRLTMHPFPGKRFSRTLSLVVTPDCSRSLVDIVNRKLRASLDSHVIATTIAQTPWLQDQFALID
ncbi:LysR family transcriptional regulator [Cognatiyoonia sp. IB215446]|uniref:LysR family transcriptional regulator n=1 Tax=Cognatiyoonia sp. IB215446 TaxID=3097355 RepID=UPI002A0BDF7A|nr:LysR family transcriptional regulator [Cognatiyoonia sp. IB215446]MDX8348101.1 LysR family transcriptional regulator [Cognatiyoonia sp. IB215446]